MVRKAKKNKNTPECVHDLLLSMITVDLSKQKLINIQSRGGLTSANDEVNGLLISAEEVFRKFTGKKDNQ